MTKASVLSLTEMLAGIMVNFMNKGNEKQKNKRRKSRRSRRSNSSRRRRRKEEEEKLSESRGGSG